MSEHTTHQNDEILLGTGDQVATLDRIKPVALLVGVVGAVACGALGLGNQVAMSGSWLFGWYFWMTITLGMLAITVLHHSIRPSWSLPLLRLLEAGASPVSLIVMGALFLPILIAPGSVYEWARPEAAHDHLLQIKSPYLNHAAWAIRFVAFFAIWFALSNFFRKSVQRQEGNREFKLEAGRGSWGAVGIVLMMLTVTFAYFDWGMTLEPRWYSTMYGVWQIIASCLGAVSFCVALLCLNATRKPYTEVVTPNLTKDWGNIMFMFTMLWAYTAISQFLIIWNGNLPETASYFARRSSAHSTVWAGIGMAVILGQFLVPWMTLLSPRVKRYPRLLRQIAGWIFVVHIFDTYLAIGPSLPAGGGFGAEMVRRAPFQYIAYDILALVTVGALWLFCFASQIRRAPLLVAYDNRLQEALKHAH